MIYILIVVDTNSKQLSYQASNTRNSDFLWVL